MSYKDKFDEAEKVGGTESLSPEYFAFEKKGDSILGMLKGVSEVQGQIGEGTYNQYLFDTDDGLVKCAFGAATDREAGSQMVIGGIYKVEFLGKEKISGGRQINKFKVLHVKGDSLSIPEKGDEAPF